jgi:hypothetical protein
VSGKGSSPAPSIGERVELARYTARGNERIVYGQWIDGAVRITDRPAAGPGRSYLVERCLERDGFSALKALVEDYTRQARRLDEIPMVASLLWRIEQVELARYTFTGGERMLYGQRVGGVVRITDRPVGGTGRSYLVERDVERDGFAALKALVEDYTRQAERLDEIPMAVSLIRRALEHEAA